MYFLPRNNAIYSFLVHVGPCYRYMLTFCVLGFITYVWLFGVYYTIGKTVGYAKKEVEELKKQQTMFLNTKIERKKIPISLQTLHDKLRVHGYKHTASEKFQELTTNILALVDRSQLSLGRCVLGKKELEDGWCQQDLMLFDLKGSFNDMKRFFEIVASSNHFVMCNNAQFTKVDQNVFSCQCTLKLGTFSL